MAERISIELLGHLIVVSGEDQVTRFRTQKTATLLAYLACYLHRSHPREELIELLWPDVDIESGRTSLRTALASLRKLIEPPDAPENSILIADRLSVRLNPEAVETDISRLESAIAQARRAETSAAKAETLSRAVAIYRGPLLPGWHDEWAQAERNRLQQLVISALRELVVILDNLGEYERAIQAASRLVALDPVDEEGHLALVRLYAVTSQAAAAKRHYREWERVAREELGQTPSAEFQVILQNLQEAGDRQNSAPPRPSAPTHASPMPSAAPASTTSLSSASNVRTPKLPLQLTRFFGREEEILGIRSLLLSEGARLLTLTGPAGTGKTRLAIEIAARLAPDFGNAVYFVSLAEIAEAGQLLEALAKALSLRLNAGEEPLEQISEALGYRPALLVLDNFEQLPEEAAEIVQTLLTRNSRLVCLITSRRVLGLGGEQEYSVAPLPVPETSITAEQIGNFSSARLFVDRARAVRPDFQVTPANVGAVAALCARLEGIPLAIELAAGWAQTQTPGQMLERLVRRFDLLTSRRKDLPPRHRTLRAAVEWSYRLLSPELQQVFARLSVFRGGWTVELAEAICAVELAMQHAGTSPTFEGSLLEDLAQLREYSLIVTEERGEVLRYRLLETLREFAQEQLSDSETTRLRARHRDVFLAFAEEAEHALSGPEQPLWFNRLEHEHENMQAALGFCQVQGEVEQGLRLAAALAPFWQVRGYVHEGLRWFATFLMDRTGISVPTRAKALSAQATLQHMRGDSSRVIELYAESLRLYEEMGDRAAMASVLHKMHSPVYFHSRNFKRAMALLERSLALNREVGNLEGIATALAGLGNLTRDQGDHAIARSFYEQSLAIYRQMGHTHGISRVLADLSYLLTGEGDFPAALACLEEALALSRALNNLVSIGHVLWLLGRTKEIQGDYTVAKAFLEEGVLVAREAGNQQQVFNSIANLGIVAELQKEYGVALERWTECLSIAREMGDRWSAANSLLNMGRMHALLGDFASAGSLSQQSLTILRDGGRKDHVLSCLEILAQGACGSDPPENGIRLFAAIEAQREEIGAPLSDQEKIDRSLYLKSIHSRFPEEEHAHLWNSGRQSTLDESVALALSLDPFSFRSARS